MQLRQLVVAQLLPGGPSTAALTHEGNRTLTSSREASSAAPLSTRHPRRRRVPAQPVHQQVRRDQRLLALPHYAAPLQPQQTPHRQLAVERLWT